MASEFVRFNETTKKFEVAAEAARLLRSLVGPICVVAICGRARQGKSFLLNQLLARLLPAVPNSRFTVGSTFRPCTKGLWLWSKPITRAGPNGQPYHLLLLDAEGIDSYDQTADYSNQIFSLALLLSSLLVYNQMGSIDETSVEKLATVCEFARLIRGKKDAGPASAAPSAAPDLSGDLSPAFVWLLRDFQFHLTENGRQLSVRDYMEEVLAELPGAPDAVRAKNQLRSSIKTVFPNRDCHALVRPLLDESQLARMDTLPPAQLRPEFRKGLEALSDLLLSRCRPKSLRGSPLTGPALAGLAEAYCRIINEGGVPAIASTWQSVVQSECRRALDAATDLYRAKLEAARRPEVSMDELESAHSKALEAAVEAFNKQAVGEPAEREGFLRRLREAAAAAVGPVRQLKRAEAEARTSEMLTAGVNRFLQSIRAPDADLVAAEAGLHSFLKELAADKALAPEKYIKAAELLAGAVVPELRRLATQCRSRAAAAEQRVSELEAKVAQLTSRTREQESSLGSATMTEAQLRRELAAVQAAAGEAVARAAAAQAAAEGGSREMGTLREQLGAARLEAAARVERAEAELFRLRSELAQAQSKRAAAEATAQQAATARSTAAQLAAEREAQLAARAAEVEAARRAAEAAKAAEAQLRQETSGLISQLAARDATVRHLQQERDFMQAQLDEQKRRLDEQEQRLAAVAAAAVPRGAPAVAGGNATAVPGGNATALPLPQPSAGADQCAATRRKRGRLAADLDPGSSGGEDDVDMVEFAGTATVAGGGGDDEDVVMVAEGAGAATMGRAAGRRQRTPAPGTTDNKRRRTTAMAPAAAAAGAAASTPGTAAATPAAAAATTLVAADGGGAGGNIEQRTPMSSERVVLRITPGGRAARATPGARAEAAVPAIDVAPSTHPPLPPNLDSMKINDIKHWLTIRGFVEDVFELNKGRPSRRDWLALVRAKCAQ